jgi:hypothetical protein
MPKEIQLFTGNAHSELAQEVAAYLGIPVGDATVTKFSDGEIMVHIHENVRGYDTFVLQPTCSPVNDNIIELLLMIDALKRALIFMQHRFRVFSIFLLIISTHRLFFWSMWRKNTSPIML